MLECQEGTYSPELALTYKWFKGSNVLTSETKRILSFNTINKNDAGTYNCMVTGTFNTKSVIKAATKAVIVHCKY